MVKADVKHNYYADLELPNTCSIDDIKRQYRKLALLYHPDRNAGKEDEYVPKFQAIQTAHEILGDQITKTKYDADRRKAGLYPTGQQTFRANQPAPGNPYAANSAYPPPPRRTQPGTWQRPQPPPPPPPQPSGTPPTGADRFTSFPRGAPTARKDPAQDRTNMFRAWQNMNSAQERQQQQPAPRFTPGSGGGAAPGPQASPNRPERPRPPPRQDTRMPSEDEIRAGMSYRKPPPPQFEAETADRGQSAWANFQQKNAGKPGVARSSTTKTPRKQGGFDPNAPGSDERPAGHGGYAHRHRSEDFGKPQHTQPGQPFPPPPPGPPPQSPMSPGTSPTSQRPIGDPLRPFKSRTMDEEILHQAPYSEANRKSTPYSSFIGERTHFRRESGDGLRRSASTRDAAKLHANGGPADRARSTSPLSRHQADQSPVPNGAQKLNVEYSESDASDSRPSSTTPEDYDNSTGTPADIGKRPGTAPHSTTPFERPKKVPTPPSTRFNGSTNPFGPPPTADGTQSDTEWPGMQQKTSHNMYVNRDPFKHDVSSTSPPSQGQWPAQMFGSSTHTASRAQPRKSAIPKWAIPSSVQPGSKARQKPTPQKQAEAKSAVGPDVKGAFPTQQEAAYGFVRSELERAYGDAPDSLNMDVFLKLASTAVKGQTSGQGILDAAVSRALYLFPSVATLAIQANHTRTFTDKQRSRTDSFTFPLNHDMFTPNGKSRSEENINTKFSPDGWSGTFQGSTDYFASPQSPVGRKPSSPFRREKSGLRSSTTRVPSAKGASSESTEMPPPPRPFSTDGRQHEEGTSGEVKFSKEQWEKTFQDASWTWPPPPPKPPSPGKVAGAKARTPGRKASKSGARSAASGTKEQPHVVDEEEPVEVHDADGTADGGAPVPDDGDAMEIDSTPPAQHQESVPEVAEVEKGKEPRLYAVPPSTWRQQQQQAQSNGHHGKTSSRVSTDASLKTSLDDLANVEPMAPSSANGLKNLSDLSSTLPFQSHASAAVPTHPLEPQRLQIPSIPKAPEPPHQLTKQSWCAFTQTFGAYLKAYHAFNNTMLQHFAAREHQAQSRLSVGTKWLEAVGDTSGVSAMSNGPSGFGSYLQGVREDDTVREAWSLGCERHAEACKGFEKVRERVRRVVTGGGLLEH